VELGNLLQLICRVFSSVQFSGPIIEYGDTPGEFNGSERSSTFRREGIGVECRIAGWGGGNARGNA
jgi:hypothetical protein